MGEKALEKKDRKMMSRLELLIDEKDRWVIDG